MNYWKKVILILFIFLALPQPVLAVSPVTTEEISSFHDDIIISQSGSIKVSENISYNFGNTPHHGIYRNIPLVSKVGNLYRILKIVVTSVSKDGASENYSRSTNGNELTIKIGDANKTLTGIHQYTITYSVQNALGTFDDHDELYWNVTGNGWNIPINQASATIYEDFAKINNTRCLTGATGQTFSNCTILKNSQFITTTPLSSHEGLTIVVGFPTKTFPTNILSTSIPQINNFTAFSSNLTPQQIQLLAYTAIGIAILYYFVLPMGLLYWYTTHKKKERFGKVTVNFDIPKDDNNKVILPAEAGTVDTAQLEANDIIATIFDLAIRKYIRISEISKGSSILGIKISGPQYQIEKLKDLTDENLVDYEQTLLAKIFESGSPANLNDFRQDFYQTFNSLSKEVFNSLINKNLYSKNPTNQRAAFLALATVSLATLNLFLGFILLWFYKKLIGRTAKGDFLDWKIDGLKIFLKGMRREYKWQANELITLERFIPYAIALGLIEEFMEQIKLIYPDYHPTWYVGSNNFYLIYPALYSNFQQNIVTNSPRSSSGFSGGGSSGGGGGGGGGGSW